MFTNLNDLGKAPGLAQTIYTFKNPESLLKAIDNSV